MRVISLNTYYLILITQYLLLRTYNFDTKQQIDMKKIMVAALAIVALVACNNESGEKKPEAGGTDLSSNPVYKEGLALVGKNNCISCHTVVTKWMQP